MNDITHRLERETEAAKVLLAQYESLIGDDEELKASTIEGETNLKEVVRQGISRIAEIEGLVASLESTIARMKNRSDRLEAQKVKIREAITAAMSETKQKRFELDIATVSIRPSQPKIVTTDELEIPARFWKQADPTLNKKAIADALKAGEKVPGATFGNAPMALSIKFG